MERTAQCHCGSLRAIALGQPRINNVCHCRACQRRTGSLLHAGAYFLKADVRCEGANKVYTRRADSGFDAHFHFCPDCGTSVYWRLDRIPDFVGIAVGCFVDPDFPPPQWSVVCDGSLESARTLSVCRNAKHHQLHMGTPLHSASIQATPNRPSPAGCEGHGGQLFP
jgi:hypothetical protein